MAKKNKVGFLSTNLLKIIAITAMVSDHASVIFIGGQPTIWRDIGRIAFPIFAFLIAQGAIHTKNKLKYLLRLVVFSVISEVPFDLAFNGTYFETKSQNVYFTLALGLISIYILDFLRSHRLGILGFVTTALCGLGAYYLHSDYDFSGVVVITLMFVFASASSSVKYVGYGLSAFLTTIRYAPVLYIGFAEAQLPAVFSVLPIALYSGRPGKKMNKYIFYAFYPVHIFILWFIKKYIV